MLFNYGSRNLNFEDYQGSVNKYIINELSLDNIQFSNENYKLILEEYILLMSKKEDLNLSDFLNHENQDIQQISITLVSKRHEISKKWEDLHQIFIGDETKNLEKTIVKSILSLKQAYLKNKIREINIQINESSNPSIDTISKLNKLNKALVKINKLLGRNFN